jgi:photosystem II stability/assembly factor-like uncharacterized protein
MHRYRFVSTVCAVAIAALLGTLAAAAPLPAQHPAPAKATAPKPAPRPADVAPSPSHAWPDTAWRQIGPASIGGRVSDIEAVASDPRIIFVGAASGGLFRSTDNGVTWDHTFDAYGTTLSIGDIAIAPSDPNVVWVGTGEANNRQSSTWGDGVYRSLDGGTTWEHKGLRDTQSIGRIVIDPRDANTVFVAAAGHLFGPNEERGLYRTHDGGTTWKKVLGVDANTGVIDVAIGDDGRTLFAATYERRRRAFGFVGGGPESGLWRSLDGGDSWTRLSEGLPTGNTGRIGVAIAKSNPSIVYAVIENRKGGVFRSVDDGTTWTQQSRKNERANYYGQIRVDPKNPDRVWLPLTNLNLSIDGGKTFTDDSIVVRVHPDNHALWIDPQHPEHMMLGNDGGVFFTYDGARHWAYDNNLPIGQFYDIAVDHRDPYWIYGGLQDLGTFMFPSATHSRGAILDDEATFLEYGDGFRVAVDPTNPRLVYANSQNGRGYVVDLVTREERRITPVPADTSETYRFNWNTAMLVSPNDPHTYYYGSNRLLATSDRGTTWRVLSPDLTRNQPDWKKASLGDGIPPRDSTTPSRDDGTGRYGNITTISESPRAPGTLYVGTDDGNVQMSTDGGAHWTNITARFHLPAPRTVSEIVASRFDARTAYVTFDGHTDDDLAPHVFRTTDGGATWSSIAGDLPAAIPVKTLAEDPRNPAVLFAGTEFGLYWTMDGGRHWAFPGGSLPRVMVDRIIINEQHNDLVLGTYGRGVIILDDIRPLEAERPASAADTVAQLFPLRDATEIYQWRDQPLGGVSQYAAPNAPVGALISYSLGRRAGGDTARAVAIDIVAPNGKVVRSLSGDADAGMHRVLWDLHTQFAFAPAAVDSGFYGAPRAPYVTPGTYTVRLIGRGRTLTQPVQVRGDSSALTTPEALAARERMSASIDSLSRVFRDGKRALTAVDTEFAHSRALIESRSKSPAVDSVVHHLAKELDQLHAGFDEEYGSAIGDAFDLLGGLEASSAMPTEAEQRTLDASTIHLRATIAKLNYVITTDMPRLRETLAHQPAATIETVKGPE